LMCKDDDDTSARLERVMLIASEMILEGHFLTCWLMRKLPTMCLRS
jgi:hypothetical protein